MGQTGHAEFIKLHSIQLSSSGFQKFKYRPLLFFSFLSVAALVLDQTRYEI